MFFKEFNEKLNFDEMIRSTPPLLFEGKGEHSFTYSKVIEVKRLRNSNQLSVSFVSDI